MLAQKLKQFLDSKQITYKTITHAAAPTAQETAASAHISGKELAKTVMVKIDGKMAMAVVPASHEVDLEQLKQITEAGSVELADEHEFQDLFPQCEVGAMPPFGNLYRMKVYVAEALAEDEQIAFNAGTHTELVQLAYKDFQSSVEPTVAKFAKSA